MPQAAAPSSAGGPVSEVTVPGPVSLGQAPSLRRSQDQLLSHGPGTGPRQAAKAHGVCVERSK